MVMVSPLRLISPPPQALVPGPLLSKSRPPPTAPRLHHLEAAGLEVLVPLKLAALLVRGLAIAPLHLVALAILDHPHLCRSLLVPVGRLQMMLLRALPPAHLQV